MLSIIKHRLKIMAALLRDCLLLLNYLLIEIEDGFYKMAFAFLNVSD